MKSLLIICGACLATVSLGQVIPKSAFASHGFAPYWKLAETPDFRCVGCFDGIKASGVWLGGPYVLFVSHGTGTHGKGSYEPVSPSIRVFVIPSEGKKYRFKGSKWHIPRATWSLDPGTESNNAKMWTTMQTAMDVCVLELESTPNIPGVQPARLYEGSSELGMDAVWVGYGIRGTDDIGTDELQFGWGGGDNPPRRFAFENKIDFINRWGYMLNSRFDTSGLALEGHQSAGSSGGGVFAKVGAEWFLIGGATNGKGSMEQQIEKTGSAFGAISGSTRLSKWKNELIMGLKGNWEPFTNISSKSFNGKSLGDQ